MTAPPPQTKRVSFRRIALIVAILALIACVAAIGVALARNLRNASRIQEAFKLADSETNDELALKLLSACIKNDPNQEEAYVKIARIYERMGEWNKAAATWQYAISLNATQTDYVNARLLALFRGQDYVALATALDAMRQNKTLTPPQAVLHALALCKTGRIGVARELLVTITDQEALASSTGKLLTVYVNARNTPRKDVIAALTEFTKDPEPAIAFDAMDVLAGAALAGGDFEQAEKWLTEACALLPETGRIRLGNFYFQRQDFDRALPLYLEVLERDINPDIATRVGDIYASRNDRDALQELYKKYRLGNKAIVLAGYYLEALIAFLDHEDAKLADALKRLNNVYNTPVAILMTLYSGLKQDQVAEVTKALSLIQANYPGNNTIQKRAMDMVMPYIATLANNQRLQEAAQLAVIIRDEKNSPLLLEQIVLTDKLGRGILTGNEVSAALSRFPEDQQILYIAAAFALSQGDYAAARKHAQTNLRLDDTKIPIQLIYLFALGGLDEKDDLAAAFKQFRTKAPDDPNLARAYLIYCTRHQKIDELKALRKEADSKTTPDFQAIAQYVEAELAWQRKDLPAMTTALKKAIALKPVNVRDFVEVEIAYRAAYLLATADAIEPAIQLYETIADYYSQKPLLLVNLSELYAANNQPEKAANAALNARQLMPTWPTASECYGVRLLETKDYARAVETLTPLLRQPERSARVFDSWTKAMEGLIRNQFDAGQLELCLASCATLAKETPNHPVAAEFTKKAKAKLDKPAP
ncbi:MAG: tetratricopeptide repeat protein [Lentisphaerae bacterium]|jgi:tetratricopeptide (TPR) repeat protein|nr:tetratricopeptide repeat protein [Lentisphaerota bacterium]